MGTIASLDVNLGMNVGAFVTSAGKARGAMTDLGRIADQVYDDTRTAAEKHAVKLTALGGLYRRGQIDVETYRRAVRKLNEELRRSGGRSPLKEFAAGVVGFGGPVAAAVAAVHAFESAVVGLSRAAAAGALHAIRLAAAYERAEIAFTTVFRSANDAQRTLRELVRFADLTPFEFPELRDAGVKLAGFGVQAKQIVPTLRVLGDIAAGVNANLGELAETYGKARIQGRAYTKDVNEFANRGVPIWDALAKSQRRSIERIKEMVEEGRIGFPELQRALIGLTVEGEQFHGALARQSQGLSGLYSTLVDSTEASFRELGLAIAKHFDLKAATASTIKFADAVKTDLVPVIAHLAEGFAELAAELNKASSALGGPDLSFQGLTTTVRGLHAAVLGVDLQISKMLGNTERWQADLRELIDLNARAAGAGAPPPGALEIERPSSKPVEEMLEAARTKQLNAQAKAREELASKTDNAARAERHFVDELTAQLRAFDKSAESAKLLEFELRHGRSEATEMARILIGQLETLREQKQAAEEAARALEEFAQHGKRIFEQTRTPLERYQAQLELLSRLLTEGAIDQETFNRAVGQAHADRLAAEKPGEEGRRLADKPGALLKGSAAAFSAANRLGGAVSEEAKTRKVLSAAARETNVHLRAMERAQRRKEQLRVIQNFN